MKKFWSGIILLSLCCTCFGQYSASGLSVSAGDVRYVQLSGTTQDITGSVTVDGYVSDKSCRAFGVLTSPSVTTVTVANTWYPVNGSFTNIDLCGFGLITLDGHDAIVYTNGYEGRFKVELLSEVSSDTVNTEVFLALKISGVDFTNRQSYMSVECGSAGEGYLLPNMGVPVLTNGTTIQIITTADKSVELTFEAFKSNIERLR